jgi:hypothetical protein
MEQLIEKARLELTAKKTCIYVILFYLRLLFRPFSFENKNSYFLIFVYLFFF